MNVLHLLVTGGTGGIEVLMRNYAACSDHKNTFLFVWGGGEIAQAMTQEGRNVVVADLKKDGLPATLKKIRQICRKEKVDAAVSHNSAPLLKLILIFLKLTCPGMRTVAYAHANARDICEHTRRKGLRLRWLVHRLGFSAADGVVAISQSVKDSLKDYFHVPADKITRIYDGTPVNPSAPVRSETVGNALRLIYVGRLIKEKGVQNSLHALATVRDELPFEFTVVGDGPYRQELEDLARDLGIEERVRFLGLRGDVSELLGRADVFLHLPQWEEGFGITVIEAMAQGLICVVNDRGALPELIEHGVSGFVEKADEPEELAQTLKNLPQMSHGEREEMGCAARRRAEGFSVERFAAQLDEYLRNLR